MELKKIVQTANKNVIYLKNGFEKVYHENVNCYDRADRYKINQTFALLTCMLGGSLFENFIGLMWKPYAAWSYVEFAGIVYFLYRGGSYGGDLVFDYLDNISTSRPIPTAYASELVEGGSYENPIDLTSSNDEEEDAEEDADEDEEEDEDAEEDEEDEEEEDEDEEAEDEEAEEEEAEDEEAEEEDAEDEEAAEEEDAEEEDEDEEFTPVDQETTAGAEALTRLRLRRSSRGKNEKE